MLFPVLLAELAGATIATDATTATEVMEVTNNVLYAGQHPLLFKGIGISICLGGVVFGLLRRYALSKKKQKIEKLIHTIQGEEKDAGNASDK